MIRYLAVAVLLAFACAHAAEPEELIADPHFQSGFILLDPKPGKKVRQGVLDGVDTGAAPVWELAQWASKCPLQNDPMRLPDGAVKFSNAGKTILTAPPESGDADICLAINGGAEYGSRLRQQGEDWVHLLVEQRLQNRLSLDRVARARLHLEARLKNAKSMRAGQSRDLHTAQFQLFFTVQNLNKASAGYGQYLWFGVSIYDERYRVPPQHATRDTGKGDATGMFIYSPEGSVFTRKSAHDQEWITIDVDIMPLIKDGLAAAWKNGFLKDSRSLSDYFIAGMNMGWEVTGIFDVEMQVRNLSLMAAPEP